MESRDIVQRIDLALLLLHQLDAANHTLAGLTLKADAACGTVLSDAKREAGDKARIKKELLSQRIGELKECLSDITRMISGWHHFTCDPEAQHHWSYPFRLIRLGRETNMKLKKEQDRISSLVLQNRLLEEEIRRLGDTVQRDALSRLKGTSGYADWVTAVERKQRIVDDLRLLLPAIPAVATCTLDASLPMVLVDRLAGFCQLSTAVHS